MPHPIFLHCMQNDICWLEENVQTGQSMCRLYLQSFRKNGNKWMQRGFSAYSARQSGCSIHFSALCAGLVQNWAIQDLGFMDDHFQLYCHYGPWYGIEKTCDQSIT